jgi:hypothetical protein
MARMWALLAAVLALGLGLASSSGFSADAEARIYLSSAADIPQRVVGNVSGIGSAPSCFPSFRAPRTGLAGSSINVAIAAGGMAGGVAERAVSNPVARRSHRAAGQPCRRSG